MHFVCRISFWFPISFCFVKFLLEVCSKFKPARHTSIGHLLLLDMMCGSRLAYSYSQGLHAHIVKACILIRSTLACAYSQGVLVQWWLEASLELPRSFLCTSSQLWGYQSHEAWSEGRLDNQSSHIFLLVLVMHVPSLSHHSNLLSVIMHHVVSKCISLAVVPYRTGTSNPDWPHAFVDSIIDKG